MGNKRLINVIFLVFLAFIGHNLHVNAENNGIYYTVMISDQNDMKKFKKIAKEKHIDITYEIKEIGLIQISTNPSQLDRLKKDYTFIEDINPSVRAVQEAMPESKTLNALPSLWDFQWDMQDVTSNGQSYEAFSGTKNVTVGIIDSGITVTHPDLKANIMEGSKNLVPENGFRGTEPNESGDLNKIQDLTGHGTHVAGQIAANGYIKGVAPEIGVKSYRVFGSKSSDSIWVIKAIVEAANDDVDVINLSLGSYLIKGKTFSSEGSSKEELAEIKGYQKAIKYAQKKGSVVVAAVGNDALNVNNSEEMKNFIQKKLDKDHITFKGKVFDVPAALPGVVTVSSTGPTGKKSIFSNYGKGFVDIAAPGGDYRYLQEFGQDLWISEGWLQKEQILGTAPNGAYFYSSGTSIAAPKVSGALALIIDKYHYKNKPSKSIHHLYKFGVKLNKKNKLDVGNGELDLLRALSY